ncbi:BglG family transcription antiterminator [Staphylococcus shinii]|uniref:BglG family transcription antiterminator n=1 Tax=Staphylococcus shinii TaxID=2912228 RepID=UPI003F5464C7
MLEMLKSRPLNILNVFLNNERCLSAKELSIIFKKTERTIRNDIKGINEFLTSNKFIEIQNHSGLYELKISNYSKEKIKRIVSVSTEEQYYNPDFRREFIISNALIKTTHKKIYELCQELKISKSTMDKDMKNIRNELKQYDLQISSNFDLGLQIIGNERNIRIYIYNHLVKKITEDKVNIDNLFESYSPLVKYIGMNNIEEVKKTYQKIISIQKNDIKKSTIILTAIWLSRNKMGHVLSDNNDDKTQKLSIINLFIDELINRGQININLNEFNYINKRLEVLIGEDNKLIVNKYETLSQLITLKLIEFIEYQLSLNFDGFQNSLFAGLSKHISGLLGRIEQGIQIYNPLKENIKENHRKIFQTIQNYGSVAK